MQALAIIFDLDGTLLDTLDDIADSMNAALSTCGFPLHPVGAYRDFIGEGLDTLVRRALPEPHRDPETVQRCLQQMRHVYGSNYAVKTRPYPGIDLLLTELRQRNIKLAVLSNKLDEFTRIMINKYFPAHHFESVWGARVDVPIKPDPAAALSIAADLQLAPGQIIFAGDSLIDIQTARNAGNIPAACLWGYTSADVLRAAGVNILLEKPVDLLNYINIV